MYLPGFKTFIFDTVNITSIRNIKIRLELPSMYFLKKNWVFRSAFRYSHVKRKEIVHSSCFNMSWACERYVFFISWFHCKNFILKSLLSLIDSIHTKLLLQIGMSLMKLMCCSLFQKWINKFEIMIEICVSMT